MRKLVSIGLVTLLLYHTLAYILVCVGSWWQAERDLSKQLLVYRSTNSLVEFQIPLQSETDSRMIARTPSDGFHYHGRYYSVVSVEVRNDTVYIAGLDVKSQSLWPRDLLSFLSDHLPGQDDTHQKAHHWLKFLFKDYFPTPRTIFCFCFSEWTTTIRIPDVSLLVNARSSPVHSPPPDVSERVRHDGSIG